jgi:hypothetical protein
MKTTFIDYCKTDFRKPKFHMTLHHVDVIRRFGSVRYADAGPGERLHKVTVKPAFRRTSKRTSTMTAELIIVLRTATYLSTLVREHNITVRRPPRPPPEVGSDSFRGEPVVISSFRWSRTLASVIGLPGTRLQQKMHFEQGLVAALLKHATKCTHAAATSKAKQPKLIQEFVRKYDRPQLFKTFRCVVGGEKQALTFRAQSSFQGKPWFDFLRCKVDEANSGTSRDYAGRALTFVSLQNRVTHEEEMLVLVEWYVSCHDEAAAGSRRRVPEDLRYHDRRLPFPTIKRQEAVSKRWELVDTEEVQGGLWVQQDFTEQERFWVLTHD